MQSRTTRGHLVSRFWTCSILLLRDAMNSSSDDSFNWVELKIVPWFNLFVVLLIAIVLLDEVSEGENAPVYKMEHNVMEAERNWNFMIDS